MVSYRWGSFYLFLRQLDKFLVSQKPVCDKFSYCWFDMCSNSSSCICSTATSHQGLPSCFLSKFNDLKGVIRAPQTGEACPTWRQVARPQLILWVWLNGKFESEVDFAAAAAVQPGFYSTLLDSENQPAVPVCSTVRYNPADRTWRSTSRPVRANRVR